MQQYINITRSAKPEEEAVGSDVGSFVDDPVDVVGDLESPGIDATLQDASNCSCLVVGDGLRKVGSAEDSHSNRSISGEGVAVLVVAEGLAGSCSEPFTEDALSGLKSGSMVGDHPFVVSSVLADPSTGGNVQSDTDESEWLVVADVLTDVSDVGWPTSELSFEVVGVEPVELTKSPVDVGLDDVVDDAELWVTGDACLIQERSHVGEQKVLHECLEPGNSCLLCLPNLQQLELFTSQFSLFLLSDFLGSHLLVTLGHLSHCDLPALSVVDVQQPILTVLAEFDQCSACEEAIRAVLVSSLEQHVFDHLQCGNQRNYTLLG